MTDEPASKPGADAGDPSMEEILASIRRILNEETNPEAPASTAPPEEADDVLLLDESMLVVAQETSAMTEPESPAPDASLEQETSPSGQAVSVPPLSDPIDIGMHEKAPPGAQPAGNAEIEPASMQQAGAVTAAADPLGEPPGLSQPSLVAPEAAAAAATSVGTLVRTLAGRGTQVYSGGPTLEDMVRAELRPLLKDWLDTNLPPLVERLVRAEIERVVGRAVP